MFVKHAVVGIGVFLVLVTGASALHHHTKREFYEEMFTGSPEYERMAEEFTKTKAVFKSREYVRIGTIVSAISESAEETEK